MTWIWFDADTIVIELYGMDMDLWQVPVLLSLELNYISQLTREKYDYFCWN